MHLFLIKIFSASIFHQISAINLSSLHNMAKCHLGYDIGVYNGYGCWCAINDKIRKPLDGIDECCAIHEKCYEYSASCKDQLQKFIFYPYNWTCDGMNYKEYERIRRKKTFVTLPNRAPIKCTSVNVGCKRDMCNCDKAVVECLANYEKPECKKKCPTTKNIIKNTWANIHNQKKVTALIWMKADEKQNNTNNVNDCEEK